MRRNNTRWRRVTVMASVLGLLATTSPAAATPRVVSIANGLVGPLGLAVADDGTAYVAEAFAGQLTEVRRSGARRTVYRADGASVAGVDATRDTVVFTETIAPEQGAATATSLERLRPGGRSRTLASLLDFEERKNPDARATYGFLDAPDACRELLSPEVAQPYTGIVESNPYAVVTDPGIRRRADRGSYLVADAAGNSIVRVSRDGRRLRTVAVLPPVPQVVTAELAAQFELDPCAVGLTYQGEPVPTDVEVGPDGHYYVSTLPGVPEAPGAGSVWRIHAKTGKVTRVATGFSGAVDLAVARDGRIYVAELFGGRISVIDRRGRVSTLVELESPGAVEVTREGAIYATTGVFAETGGSLVRVRR